jgi:hypothetical protein
MLFLKCSAQILAIFAAFCLLMYSPFAFGAFCAGILFCILLPGIFSAWNFAVVFRGWPQGQQLDCRATLKLPLTARSAIGLPRFNQNRGIYEQLLLWEGQQSDINYFRLNALLTASGGYISKDFFLRQASQQQLLRDVQEMLLRGP